MPKFLAVKTPGNQLVPLPEYCNMLDYIGNGEVVKVEVTKPRELWRHRRFFALIQSLWALEKMQDNFESVEGLRMWLTVQAGHYRSMYLEGVEVRIPKSINFADMDDTEFRAFYDRAVNAVLQKYLPRYQPENLDKYVETFCRF